MTAIRFVLALTIGLIAGTAWSHDSAGSTVSLAAAEARLAPALSHPEDPLLQQELRQTLYSAFSAGYMALLQADPDYPDFWPVLNQAYNFFAPNPDNVYYATPINPQGVYRISGYRGSRRIVDFQIAGGPLLPYGYGKLGATYANYDLDRDVKLDKDGAFDVELSASKPKDHKGDWWKLDPQSSYILVRQVSYDWKREIDGRFAIERLDVPAVRPRLSAAQLDERLSRLDDFAENWTRLGLQIIESVRAKKLINQVVVRDYNAEGGLSTQKYIEGLFDLKPDEALIYETVVPQQCRYWNLQLTDELWRMVDPLHRQTSLNGYTAKLDKDGKFRAVISSRDPGVPNWLDTAGYARGEIFGRWTECNEYPQPSVKKVKLADVRRHLPKDTAKISAAQREAELRERRTAAQLRRRW